MGKSLTCEKKFLAALYKPMGKSLTCEKKFLASSCIKTNGKITNLQEKVSCNSAVYKPMGKSLTCEKKFLASRPCINQWENH